MLRTGGAEPVPPEKLDTLTMRNSSVPGEAGQVIETLYILALNSVLYVCCCP